MTFANLTLIREGQILPDEFPSDRFCNEERSILCLCHFVVLFFDTSTICFSQTRDLFVRDIFVSHSQLFLDFDQFFD